MPLGWTSTLDAGTRTGCAHSTFSDGRAAGPGQAIPCVEVALMAGMLVNVCHPGIASSIPSSNTKTKNLAPVPNDAASA